VEGTSGQKGNVVMDADLTVKGWTRLQDKTTLGEIQVDLVLAKTAEKQGTLSDPSTTNPAKYATEQQVNDTIVEEIGIRKAKDDQID
jgi:hypothetical protein